MRPDATSSPCVRKEVCSSLGARSEGYVPRPVEVRFCARGCVADCRSNGTLPAAPRFRANSARSSLAASSSASTKRCETA
eukprot:3840646-Pleurochrysis_carterae.AAC.4